MIEVLKHFFGLCGEPHPNLWTVLAGVPVFSYAIYRVKNIFINKKNE